MIEAATCACGCGRLFEPTRAWHVFATPRCRKRGWAERWRRKRPRRVQTEKPAPRGEASRRAQAVHNASERISTRNQARSMVKVATIAGALETLARERPDFFLKLAASVEGEKRRQAAALQRAAD